MRKTLVALGVAAGIALVCCQTAGAFPADVSGLQAAATTTSPVEKAQYASKTTRKGYLKCYRQFAIGEYSCHRYTYW